MARRTWDELEANLPDNTSGLIDAVHVREALIDSQRPHVEARPPDTTDNASLGFDVGHTWIDSSASPWPEAWRCVYSDTMTAIWARIEGPKGPQGEQGPAGADGADGVGVPAGGTPGQVLKKASGTDYDTEWADETGGVEAFTDLSDAPSDYTGSGGKLVAVTAGADGLEFVDPPNAPDLTGLLPKLATVNSYAGNRTLDGDDSGAYIRVTGAATITLPDGLSTGFQCVIVNATDSDTVVLSAATTLTIPAGFEPEIQNRRAVTVIHVGSNVWEVHGGLVEEA